ncbi:MAG: hypothetical protein IFK91_07145 [Acidobacteria bacterium]|nr:hypothetical protein [Candidatus Sulfomarinibacter sp. MAG AM1]
MKGKLETRELPLTRAEVKLHPETAEALCRWVALEPGSDRADEMIAEVEEIFFQVPELQIMFAEPSARARVAELEGIIQLADDLKRGFELAGYIRNLDPQIRLDLDTAIGHEGVTKHFGSGPVVKNLIASIADLRRTDFLETIVHIRSAAVLAIEELKAEETCGRENDPAGNAAASTLADVLLTYRPDAKSADAEEFVYQVAATVPKRDLLEESDRVSRWLVPVFNNPDSSGETGE